MIVNGIIAEYNPLHRGHIYQLQDAQTHTGADYTIVVMSGNYVQRGAPAILDKHRRARLALLAGADLVLELPVPYALGSAEFFAKGSVSLLNKLGVVDYLCFGSECGETDTLQQIAKPLAAEPENYQRSLQQHLKTGLSYPLARTKALNEYFADCAESTAALTEVLSSPNNILGIEYIKALLRLGSNIKPYTTKRRGAGYADPALTPDTMSSALAVRKALFDAQMQDTTPTQLRQLLASSLPDYSCDTLMEAREQQQLICRNDLSSLLIYKLITEKQLCYDSYLDVSSDLSDKIRKQLQHYQDFDSFCDLLKSKELTHTRISRALMHILLDIKKDTLAAYEELEAAPYARVLGFQKKAEPLLSAIKAHSSIPLLTKLADAETVLTPSAYALLKEELAMNQIYYSMQAIKSHQPMQNEYRIPISIL